MNNGWYIEIEGKAEGPYTIRQLKYDLRITPDTLVWKEGFSKWLPMRKVPELKEVFQDSPKHKPPKNNDKEKKEKKGGAYRSAGKDELAITLHRDFPPFLIWLLLVLVILSYLIYRFYDLP